MEKRILIIKLGSIGDVLRTTPILWGLKEAYPSAFINWLTYEDSLEVLEGNKYINRLLSLKLENVLGLLAEEFDILINLDKDLPALALANLIKAKEKKGFGMGMNGNIIPLNHASEYSVRLGLDDELKFYKNKKTYPELIFECAELPYSLEYEYILDLPEDSIEFANNFFKKNSVKSEDILVGISTGAGKRFTNKMLSIEGIIKLIKKLRNLDLRILLLGGPLEIGINKKIKEQVEFNIIDSGYTPIKNFAALIKRCDLIISPDSLAMHIAIALKRPVLVIFGPTCPQEIELYGRGKKIISKINCSPCYKNLCDKKPNCMDLIDIDEVYNKAVEILSANKTFIDNLI